jgi:hypothetical protein
LKKHPFTPDLCARNEPSLGAAAQFLGMHAQERGGFFEVERFHVAHRILNEKIRQ